MTRNRQLDSLLNDRAPRGAVLRVLGDHQLQRFVTSPSGTRDLGTDCATVFHVEHGALTAAATRDVHD